MPFDYDDLINWMFDRPVAGPGLTPWYSGLETGAWHPEREPEKTLEYVTRLFEKAGRLGRRFSSEQIGQGLWYLCDPSCSSHLFVLTDASLPWPQRKRALEAVAALFGDLFAKKCAPRLSHSQGPAGESGTVAPPDCNLLCYMFWDIAPLGPRGTGERPEPSDLVCLDVMERILLLDHVACQEAALHGLAHWQEAYPRETSDIIDRYLSRKPADAQLERYAAGVRRGCVL